MIGIAEKLKRSIIAGRAMHAYLITCSAPEDAHRLAEECAALLLFGSEKRDRLSLSPDYFPFDGGARVDEIREVRRELSKRSFAGGARVVLIKNVHLLNDSAVNAMLKLLEEPPEGTHFIFTGHELRTLETIRSRCTIIRLGELDPVEIEKKLIALGALSHDAHRLSLEGSGSLAVSERLMADVELQKLRRLALNTFFSVLGGGAPLSAAATLGADNASAESSLSFMLSACHDVLLVKSGARHTAAFNADHQNEIAALAGTLGFCELRRVVELINTAASRLTPYARAARIIERLLTDLMGADMKCSSGQVIGIRH